MDNRQIIEHLNNNPIYKQFDTPDIMTQTASRSSPKLNDPNATPYRSKWAKPEKETEYVRGPTEYVEVPGPTVYREPLEPDFDLPPVKKGKKAGLGSKKKLRDELDKISNFFK